MSNRVIKVETDRYTIDCNGEIIVCHAQKKVKRNSDIVVGDIVDLEEKNGEYVVKNVTKRKNSLIRPCIANVDAIVMTIAPIPEPDYYLVDKMIINCSKQDVDCIICVNKTDLDGEFCLDVERQFSADATVVKTSAIDGDVSELKEAIKGKFTCFAGQSAVGKSSLLNALVGSSVAISGKLSGNNRGKNTTTRATLYALGEDTFIADTPGFGLLEIFSVEYDELDLYYNDYVKASHNCKYHRCAHIFEPDCEVKRLVNDGKLSKARYDRYVTTYTELKNKKKY